MSMIRSASALAFVAVLAGAGSARAQEEKQAPAAPTVGALAPDFTVDAATAAGPTAKPVSLKELKGKVVVLAFYPADRTRGCTAELTKFRDEYQKLFTDKVGKDVVVLPISVQDVNSHASWAKDASFPFTMLADPDKKVGALYGAAVPDKPYFSRMVFVIGKDGKIAYENTQFGALSEDAYTELADAVAKAAK